MLLYANAGAQQRYALQWENGRAVSVWISSEILRRYPVGQDSAFLLSVRISGAETSMVGHTLLETSGVTFRPLLPFGAGNDYQIFWRNKLVGDLSVPKSDAPIPELRIYPTSDTVPSNLLKIYIAFDQPMQQGQSHEYIRIIAPPEDTLESVFLFLTPELWNAENTMLTLWLDPGRIKRDLLPHQELGPPLESNTEYVISVLPGWRSIAGSECGGGVRRIFVTSPDRVKPEAAQWRIATPSSNSFDPLVISFDESMDYGSLLDALRIFSPEGEVEGNATTDRGESRWAFVPLRQWIVGPYLLKIEASVEDLAGNNLLRLFDVELQDQPDKNADESILLERTFEVR